MKLHANARLVPKRRAEMVRRVIGGELTYVTAAQAYGVSTKTVGKWVARFKDGGEAALMDRSSRPERLPTQLPDATRQEVVRLRRERLTGKAIAKIVGVHPATVSRILRAEGLSREKDLQPKEADRRYEHEAPGDMLHLDIKKLGRFERPGHRVTGDRTGQSTPRARGKGYGWEFVHVAIDDHSRLTFTAIHPDEKAGSATAHLRAAVRWYQSLGITVRRVMTDNGSCYRSNAFRLACRELKVKHIRTKPYSPRTNGKAERFIQTTLREWAYAQPYDTSDRRADALPRWTHFYNWHRPHAGIGDRTPISRL
ncbi:MAG: IS481 family transposase, partial [Pseudomonadota bacterium]